MIQSIEEIYGEPTRYEIEKARAQRGRLAREQVTVRYGDKRLVPDHGDPKPVCGRGKFVVDVSGGQS